MKLNIRTISKLVPGVFGILFLLGCNNSFLERQPETSVTPGLFFKTVDDLELYTNGFYNEGYFPSSNYNDVLSDNVIYSDENNKIKMMKGLITPAKADDWEWKDIRNINLMLSRLDDVQGTEADVNHFVGIARLARANRYYGKVKSYSDVPWYERDLQTNDTEELYKTQDSRKFVVDKIMEDLEFATTWVKEGSSKTRITKMSAWAAVARIALHEGTFRKYHPELNLDDADKYLEIAYKAAEKVIESGNYSIYKSTGDEEAYTALFTSYDQALDNNPEILLYQDYEKSLRSHNAQAMLDWTHTLSRDLMEDYLYLDAGVAKPFTQVAGYDQMTVLDVFQNRDPRIKATFMQPGYVRPGGSRPKIPTINNGGYPQVKFQPLNYDEIDWNGSYNDLPSIRYAEVLLVYAEAKAELGILTDADVELTVNDIRSRVSMPGTSLATMLATIDPVQEQRYPNVNSAQKGAVLEIRRERRIELACEGFRYDDLMRWGCGQLLAKRTEGVYFPGTGAYDFTGDGLADIIIAQTAAERDAIRATLSETEQQQATSYVLAGNDTFALTGGNSGYVYKQSLDGLVFMEPKYYYYPISQNQITLNKNLVQNQYWR